jgi:hypothetical protein
MLGGDVVEGGACRGRAGVAVEGTAGDAAEWEIYTQVPAEDTRKALRQLGDALDSPARAPW